MYKNKQFLLRVGRMICFAESNCGSSLISKALISGLPKKTVAEEFLNSENDKSDYDW